MERGVSNLIRGGEDGGARHISDLIIADFLYSVNIFLSLRREVEHYHGVHMG